MIHIPKLKIFIYNINLSMTTSIQNYNEKFDLLLLGIALYCIAFIYSVRRDLYDLFNKRISTPSFYLGIILMVAIVVFYRYYNSLLDSYKTKELSPEDKDQFAKLQTNVAHLKFAIISGISAIIIGSLALIDKVLPGFFITLIITYYADQNI